MTWDEVKKKVEDAGGVLTITMDVLRDAEGAGKLGIHIRASIDKNLAGIGLGHVPTELPSNQHEQVRLYKKGTSVGDLIDTVLHPSDQNDKKLLEQTASDGPDYRAIVEAVRELVNE